MTFYILGLADKRPVVYPLLYALSMSGSTLFVSDDGAYRRLLTSYDRAGHIGNVFVFTNADINDEVLKQANVNTRDYDHVVYALMDDTKGGDGITIYIKQDDSPFRENHPLDNTEQTQDFKTVHIGFKAPTQKGAFFIPITEALIKECHTAENLCRLSPAKNAKVISVLSAALAPSFGKTEKEMRKLLCYKGADRK